MVKTLAVLGMAATLGCMGTSGNPTRGTNGYDRDVRGEVQRVDEELGELRLETDDGRTVSVAIDESTPVRYQGQDYRPSSLDPGDLVTVRVRDDRSGRPTAEWIEVDQSVQARRDTRPVPAQPDDTRRSADEVRGEVASVRPEDRELTLDTSGGLLRFRYDSGTQVTYRGERGEVIHLDPGDLVTVGFRRDSSGSRIAEWVEVTEAVQERGTNGGAVGTNGRGTNGQGSYSGTVEWVDSRQGAFGLRMSDGRVMRISVPFNARDDARDRFSELRAGDRVTVRATSTGRDAYELLRFD